jgi:hypothetical protein
MSLKRFHVKRQTDSYSWSENEEVINISCSAKGMTIKHFDIFISDLFVKVNITKIKHIIVWDLKHEIVIDSQNTKITVANGQVDIRLVKATTGIWSDLEFDGSKGEKLKRRNESIKRFEEWGVQKDKEQGETKLKLDKAALDKQMELEAWERSVLKEKRNEEKQYVEDKLYEDLEQIESLNQKLRKGYDPKLVQKEAERIASESMNKLDHHRRVENKVEEVKEPLKANEPNKEESSSSQKRFKQYNDPVKNIFDDEDIVTLPKTSSSKTKKRNGEDSDDEDKKQGTSSDHIRDLTGEIPEDERILKDFTSDNSNLPYVNTYKSRGAVEEIVEEPEPLEKVTPDPLLPQVGQGGSKKVDFTERFHSNLPARESHRKEAPFPKSKKYEKPDKSQDPSFSIEDKDPVWLKDKGDHFYKRHDFNSAMNAYTKSIKNDPGFLK